MQRRLQLQSLKKFLAITQYYENTSSHESAGSDSEQLSSWIPQPLRPGFVIRRQEEKLVPTDSEFITGLGNFAVFRDISPSDPNHIPLS